MQVSTCNVDVQSNNFAPLYTKNSQFNPTKLISDFQFPKDKSILYDRESVVHKLKGGFEAEVIDNPGRGIINKYNKIKNELGLVLMKAFEKPWHESEHYLKWEKFSKITMDVDYLIVVRKDSKPIAFTSGTFIKPHIFYINSSMVMPKYQTTGIGFAMNAILWTSAIDKAKQNGYSTPDFICRTHNKNIASSFIRLLHNGIISTESDKSKRIIGVIAQTTEYLGCSYNSKKGITENIYPEGLPSGHKMSDERIKKAFREVGEKDACYVVGQLNQKLVEYLLNNLIKDEISIHNLENEETVLDAA